MTMFIEESLGCHDPALPPGPERDLAQAQAWATGYFTWAVLEYRKTEAMVKADPDNERLRKALADIQETVIQRLFEYEGTKQ